MRPILAIVSFVMPGLWSVQSGFGLVHPPGIDFAALAGPAENAGEEVEFKNGEMVLAGTLTLPKDAKNPVPAAVIISGSGLQVRDGGPVVGNLYRAIAERLTEQGVAVLRHDDRGIGKSGKLAKPVTYTDLVEDSKAAVAYLRTRKEIDPERIILIGHSEGSGTAIKIANEDKRLAGIALLAGNATSLEKLVMEQALLQSALADAIDPGDRKKLHPLTQLMLTQIEKAKAGEKDESVLTSFEYFREHIAFEPQSAIKKVACPIAILQGERDYLVPATHAIALAESAVEAKNQRVLLRIFPRLSHHFMPFPGDKNVAEEERKVISAKMLDTLAKWAEDVLLKKEEPAK